MTKGQRYALGHHLSEWPKEGMDFETILQLIESGDYSDDAILIWEPFEDMDCVRVAESISVMADEIDKLIKEGQ